MSNRVRGLLFLGFLAGAGCLGVAWARPSWVPSWARVDLAGWRDRIGGADDGDDDERGREGGVSGDRKAVPGEVRLASAELARRIGIETVAVARQRHARTLECNAETAYDARRSAEVLPRVAGVVREVKVDLGQVVRRGDVMAVVDSAQVGAAKAQYLMARAAEDLAHVTYDRTVKLTQAKAAPGKTELEALTALNQARAALLDAGQKLRNLGFTDADLARVARDGDTSNLLDVAAPIGGTVTAWDATLGEAVEPTTQMFALADTSRLWVWVDVYEPDADAVASGQAVTFRVSGGRGPAASGVVTWVGTEVNPTTRTARVRAEVANPGGRLRANQFGRASIRLEPEHDALVVPRAAVQEDGDDALVFVPVGPGVYRARKVETAPTDRDDVVEVVRGLAAGERVVTARSYILKSELYRDRLGAADND